MLAATFLVLGTLPLVFLAELGVAVALGVLLDTMIVRSVLVTAINLDLGGKIWWPSTLDRDGHHAPSQVGSEAERGLTQAIGPPPGFTGCGPAGALPRPPRALALRPCRTPSIDPPAGTPGAGPRRARRRARRRRGDRPAGRRGEDLDRLTARPRPGCATPGWSPPAGPGS